MHFKRIERELVLMCRTGIYGVIAVGIIVTIVLETPILLLEFLAQR